MRLPDINQLRPGNWNPLLCKQPSRGARFPQCRRCSCTLRVVGVGIIPWRPGCQGWVLGWRVLVGKKLCGKKGVHSIIQQKIINLIPKKTSFRGQMKFKALGMKFWMGRDKVWPHLGNYRITVLCFFLIWPTINLVSKKKTKITSWARSRLKNGRYHMRKTLNMRFQTMECRNPC